MNDRALYATVVMPVKNGAATILEAIQSVLQPSEFMLELIVVDDGSTDGTIEIVEKIDDKRLRLMKCEGAGQSDALNTGIRHASGNVFMRCDADDKYAGNRITWQLEILSNEPDLGGVCGEVSAMTADGVLLGKLANVLESGERASELLKTGKMCSHLGAYAIRIEVVRRAGGFRKFFRYSQDYDFLFRVAEISELKCIHLPAYVIRFSSASVCRRTPLAVRRWYMSKAQEFRNERARIGTDPLQRSEIIEVPDEANAPLEVENVSKSISDVLGGIAWEHYRNRTYGAAMIAAARAVAWTPFRMRSYISLFKISALSSLRLVRR